MNVVEELNSFQTFITGLVILLAGGVASYFVIKYQVNKNLKDTIDIYKGELEAMKLKMSSMQEQITDNLAKMNSLQQEKDGLKFKKDYLKNIVIQALASKVSVDQTLSKELNAMLKVAEQK